MEEQEKMQKKAKLRAKLFDAGINPYTEEGEKLVKELLENRITYIPSVFGPPHDPVKCPKCKGTGKQFNLNKCKYCGGSGEALYWVSG